MFFMATALIQDFAVRGVLVIISGFAALFSALGVVLALRVALRKFNVLNDSIRRLLIVAPHQDDGIAMAAGLASRVLAQRGEVRVCFTTAGTSKDRDVRQAEAIKAWASVGLTEPQVCFFPAETLTGYLDQEEIESAVSKLRDEIHDFQPDAIVRPAYEGGHYQHDVTNYMVHKACQKSEGEILLLDAPLYNFYYSFWATPEKLLTGFLRLLPLKDFDYAPEPVRRAPLWICEMTADDIVKKRNLIRIFHSQNPEPLTRRLGFEDRFQKNMKYDYTRPPFRYCFSVAYWVNILKETPHLNQMAERLMRWSRTIHPDPQYTMTRIPGAEN